MNRIIIYFCLLATAFGMASADDHLSMTIPELRERLTGSWLIKSKSPDDGKCNIENVISESKTRHSTLPDSLIPKGDKEEKLIESKTEK